MKRERFPYYDVMLNEGRKRPFRTVASLATARQLKKGLRKMGNDAFILKVWRDKDTGSLYEDVVR